MTRNIQAATELNPRGRFAAIIVVALLYFVAAQAGFRLAYVTDQVTAVWPPSGLALAALLILGRGVWPGVLLGAFTANALNGESLLTAASVGAGNTAASLVGLALLHRLPRFDRSLAKVSDVLGLTVLGGAAASLVSATSGTASLAVGSVVAWAAYPDVWRVWWVGDTMGVLLVAPLLLTWSTSPRRPRNRARRIELAAVFIGLTVFSYLGYFSGTHRVMATFLQNYAAFPFIVWLALRFRQREVAAAAVMVTVWALWGLTRDPLSLSDAEAESRLIAAELYMAMTALTGYLLCAVTQERRSADLGLVRTSQQLELALQGSGLGTWDWDVLTGAVVYDEQWAAMLGHDVDDLPPSLQAWQDRIHPDDGARVAAALHEHLAGRTSSYESRHRLRHRDGRWVWILDRGRVVERAADGSPRRACGTHQDITAEREAEAAANRDLARREREAAVVSALAASPELAEGRLTALATRLNEAAAAAIGVERVGVWLFEDDGRKLVNLDNFVASTGIHTEGAVLQEHEFRNEFDALRQAKYVDAHDALTDPRTAGYVEGYLRSNRITSMLDAVIRAGGDILGTLCFEHVERPHRWLDDEIAFACQLADQVALAVAHRDRRRAEAEQELLMSAIEQAAESIIITDPLGTIVYVNPAFEELTGYGRREAIGRNPRVLKSGRHDQEFYRGMWDTLVQGRTWKGRMINRKKDGSLFTEEAIISPVLDHEGRIVNYVAAKRDITEALHLQERYRQAQREESLGRLAGGVAHDLNNMLSPIIGFSELLQDDLASDAPALDAVGQIMKAGLRARDLVSQLLAFSRKQTLDFRVVDLAVLVEEMHKLLRRTIPEDVRVQLSLPAAPALVLADAGQMEQVVMNLVVNAAEAMSAGGTMTVDVGVVRVQPDTAPPCAGLEPGAYAVLAVGDTGNGMDEATRERVFEPFFTTKESGTGLGLATVLGIVTQHGGRIRVDSEPGEGATFTVWLPLAQGAAADHPAAPDRDASLTGSETVLIVEDNDQVRDLARAVLDRRGYRTLAAQDGRAALALLAAAGERVDLLLTDVVMPGMNGRELYETASADRPGLKVLYMSGYMDDIITERGVLNQGVAFLAKPFPVQALAQKVRAVLDA